jgi:urease accessory protein
MSASTCRAHAPATLSKRARRNMQFDSDWLLWQLADSAFPSGGFAHSGGLEAARQTGEVPRGDDLREFVKASLLQAATAAAPYALAARATPDAIAQLDRRYDAFLSNHVANRASRAQGQGFLAASVRTLGMPALRELALRIRADDLPGHWPVVFGAVGGCLGLSPRHLARLLLFITLRGLISSAVRLGVVGPMHAQSLQFELHDYGDWLVERSLETDIEEAAQTAPVIELLQGLHDRLYSKLFLS